MKALDCGINLQQAVAERLSSGQDTSSLRNTVTSFPGRDTTLAPIETYITSCCFPFDLSKVFRYSLDLHVISNKTAKTYVLRSGKQKPVQRGRHEATSTLIKFEYLSLHTKNMFGNGNSRLQQIKNTTLGSTTTIRLSDTETLFQLGKTYSGAFPPVSPGDKPI